MIEPINIEFSTLNFATIVPMLLAILGAITILVVDLVSKKANKSLFVILTVLFLLLDFGALYTYSGDIRGMFDLILLDGIAMLSQGIIILGSILFILISFSKQRFQEYRYPEFFALYLFAIAGFQFMVSSDSLILIFLGLETASLAIYTMIAMHNRLNAIEAAIKYFTMGALSAGFFAFGAMVLYAATGSIDLEKIAQVMYESNFENYAYLLAGTSLMLVALGFKLSLVPFHVWVADVYEGSNPALVGFLAVIPKLAGFVVVLRFFEIYIASNDKFVEVILFAIVVLTMTIPNIIALLQKDIKRMLAYSSISNAGFAMAAILIGTTQATTALFLYWILFMITNLGAFTLIWLNQSKSYATYLSDHSLERYTGFAKTNKAMALLFGLFLLSLAGVPPFALFWGKLYLLGSAINAGYIILAIVIVLNSAIAAFYYLRPIVYMFLKEEENTHKLMQNSKKRVKIVVWICAILTLSTVLYIQDLIEYVSYYVQISGF